MLHVPFTELSTLKHHSKEVKTYKGLRNVSTNPKTNVHDVYYPITHQILNQSCPTHVIPGVTRCC